MCKFNSYNFENVTTKKKREALQVTKITQPTLGVTALAEFV